MFYISPLSKQSCMYICMYHVHVSCMYQSNFLSPYAISNRIQSQKYSFKYLIEIKNLTYRLYKFYSYGNVIGTYFQCDTSSRTKKNTFLIEFTYPTDFLKWFAFLYCKWQSNFYVFSAPYALRNRAEGQNNVYFSSFCLK